MNIGISPCPLFRLALLCFAAYCLVTGVVLNLASVMQIPLHSETTYTEAPPAAYVALWTARTGRLYSSINSTPFNPQPYGPIFYMYNALIGRLAHYDLPRVFVFGRVFTFALFWHAPW